MRTFTDSPKLYQAELEQMKCGLELLARGTKRVQRESLIGSKMKEQEQRKLGARGEESSKEPIKTLASGKLPGIEVSLACIQNLKFLPNL